ncbi:MAG: hypothetical protein ACKV22_25615, partial [Bryobacteraceae bacterium]
MSDTVSRITFLGLGRSSVTAVPIGLRRAATNRSNPGFKIRSLVVKVAMAGSILSLVHVAQAASQANPKSFCGVPSSELDKVVRWRFYWFGKNITPDYRPGAELGGLCFQG